jgi:2,3-bisphosphoglycerate-dependent phosphoglycerate mutase
MHERFLVGVEGVREVWLIRHGDAYTDVASLGDGDLDPPLSIPGRRQADLLGRRLAAARVAAVWASDLVRARETAEIAAAYLPDVMVAQDLRLREVTTHWAVGEVPPEPPEPRPEDYYPYLEPPEEVIERTQAVVLDIARELEARGKLRGAAVTHAALIGIYAAHLLGTRYGMPILPQYTSVTVLRVKGERVVLQSLADIAHRVGEELD